MYIIMYACMHVKMLTKLESFNKSDVLAFVTAPLTQNPPTKAGSSEFTEPIINL